MTDQYGPDNFSVTNDLGSLVAAKYLTDANGQYIIDPLTQKPYIVPADYDPARVIAQFSTLKDDYFAQPFLYGYFISQFFQYGPNDLPIKGVSIALHLEQPCHVAHALN